MARQRRGTVSSFRAVPVVHLISGRDPFSPDSLRRRKTEVLKFIPHAPLEKAEGAR